MLRRILCAIDGSRASERAVDFAVRFAREFGAELRLIRSAVSDVLKRRHPPVTVV